MTNSKNLSILYGLYLGYLSIYQKSRELGVTEAKINQSIKNIQKDEVPIEAD
tara:strand:+ start:1095 stop:1250 length:156 start_codon:yes stop_codon:yes gene_type:complete